MILQVVFNASLNIWIFIWDDGSNQNCNQNTLNYAGGGTPLLDMILPQSHSVLPDGLELYSSLMVIPTLVVHGPIPSVVIFLSDTFPANSPLPI